MAPRLPGVVLFDGRNPDRLPKARRYHFQPLLADADCAGLPNTLRHSALSCARLWCMQAMIRPRLGISEEQSRKTSGVQSRC
jgi:uncharacterized iron-regulated membrane protein